MIDGRIWVVVADGERARILRRSKLEKSYHTERSFDSASAHKRTSALVTDEQDRSYESVGAARHAIEPRSDPHRMEKQRFVTEVARALNEAAGQGEFDGLVLVAPAHALGTLRKALSPGALARVTGSLAKDLTKTPDGEIGSHLSWEMMHGPSA